MVLNQNVEKCVITSALFKEDKYQQSIAGRLNVLSKKV